MKCRREAVFGRQLRKGVLFVLMDISPSDMSNRSVPYRRRQAEPYPHEGEEDRRHDRLSRPAAGRSCPDLEQVDKALRFMRAILPMPVAMKRRLLSLSRAGMR